VKLAAQRVAAAQGDIVIAGVSFVADPDGALYWPEHGLLAVADLHLEKGSSFAARGQLLPPYDTAVTLARLARLIARYAPRAVLARLESEVRAAIALPAVRDRLQKLGLHPVGDSAAEFTPFVATAIKRMSEAARVAGIEPE